MSQMLLLDSHSHIELGGRFGKPEVNICSVS
jgi:hypothetical protein